jgi:outer membrane protein insertion porin family
MKRRFRRRTRVLPFLLTATVPATGLSLLLLDEKRASAHTVKEKSPLVQETAPQPPQTQPGGQPPVQAGLTIGEIIITGNKVLNSEAIIIFSGHKVGDPCNNQVLAEMQENILKTGYFGLLHSNTADEAVNIRTEENNPPDGKCKVIIAVDENPKIVSTQIEGSGPIKPEEIQKLITQTPVYNPGQFARDAITIQEAYEKQGYAAVISDVNPDEQGVLKIGIVVARVAEIKVAGNRKTKKKVILREMQTKEGDYFNVNTLLEDRRRLTNLDLFEEVGIAESNLGPGRIGLTINVPEKRSGQILAGVGFSNRAQLIGTAEISDTNFQGMGRAVSLRWEAGGAVGRNSVELGFFEPWLDKSRTALDVRLYDRTFYRFSQNLSNAVVGGGGFVGTDTRYNEQRTGLTLTASRPFRKTYRGALTLRGENVRADPLALTPENAAILQNGPIISIGGSILHNTRDLDLDPVTGAFQSYNLQVGYADIKPVSGINPALLPGVFGKSNFMKTFVDLRYYIPLAGARDKRKLDEQKTTLALRTYLGTSLGRLPFFEQFFLGGAESLRGYREDRFWGENVMLGSVELRQPIARGLNGVLFLDIGTAWGGEFRDVNLQGFSQNDFKIHGSLGLGIRVRTPIGPLRLDFGFGDEGGRTHISFGNVF